MSGYPLLSISPIALEKLTAASFSKPASSGIVNIPVPSFS